MGILLIYEAYGLTIMLTIGQIGLGRWGKNIARTLEQNNKNVRLITADTPNETKALADQRLDGVIIATPGSTHAAVALPFIVQSIPTFIEKPFTTSLADAKKLAAAAQASGALVFIGHIHLYNPAYQQAKKSMQDAGPIRSLYFEGMNNGPIRSDMSALWDWSPHDVAMAIDLLGTMPKHVQAWGQAILRPETTLYDSVQLKLTFPQDVVALITNSWLSPEKRKKVTITCADDTVVYDDTAEQKVTLYSGLGPIITNQAAQEQQPTISYPPYSKQAPLEIELNAFLGTITTKQQPVTDIKHAIQVMQVLDAAERSIQLDGAPIEL